MDVRIRDIMKACVLGSSSEGNATAIWTENAKILIDAGFSAKELERRLKMVGIIPSEIKGILVSHEHTDNVRGASVFSRKYKIPVYANRFTFKNARSLDNVWEKRPYISHEEFRLGDLEITSLVVPHDASEPNAFVIKNKEKKITIATDLGKHTPVFIEQSYDSDLIILESNYDKKMLLTGFYPPILKKRILSEFGHLSNNEAGKTLRQIIGSSTKQILLAHLSQNNNTPDLAVSVTREHIKDFEEVNLGLTYPHKCSKIIKI